MPKRRNYYEEFEKWALARPGVREAFEEGWEELRLAVSIAERREKLGLTQAELAAKVGTSQAVISRIENGGNVELKTLLKIARVLNATLELTPRRYRKGAQAARLSAQRSRI